MCVCVCAGELGITDRDALSHRPTRRREESETGTKKAAKQFHSNAKPKKLGNSKSNVYKLQYFLPNSSRVLSLLFSVGESLQVSLELL